MDNKALDKKGISAVTDYLCNVGFIDPHLNSDDTIAMWDGYLFVYKTKDKFSNANYDYRVPAQVKTTKINDALFPERTTFPVPIVDLQHYLNDGGLVFFKVLVNCQNISQVYCAFLTKDNIESILKNVNKQHKKSIHLEKAPSDFKTLLENLRRIDLQRRHQPINWADLPKYDDLKFSFQVEHISSDTNIFEYIATHSVDLLVSSNNFPGEFYTKGGPAKLHIIQEVKTNVIIGDRIFYNSYRTSFEEDGRHFFFGDSVNLVMPYKEDENSKGGCNIKINANSIDKIILDFEFIIAFFEVKHISIGNYQIEIDGVNISDTKLNEYRNYLKFWQDVRSVFTILHIQCTLNPDSFSDRDEYQLRTLIQSFIYNKPVYGNGDKDFIHIFKIAEMNIYVFAKHIGERQFLLRDIYDNFCATSTDEKNNILISPLQSAFFGLEQLPANLVLTDIVSLYKEYKQKNPMIAIQANLDLLNILNHYDRCHNTTLLDAAVEISTWLKNEENNVINNKNILLLNYLQTIIRKNGKLNDDEKKQLKRLKTSDDIENFARYLLLGNKEKAMLYLKKIPNKDVNFLKTLPIYHFISDNYAAMSQD